MGMVVTFLRISDQELETYKKNSQLLEDRIYSDEIDDDPNFIEIEKSWDGIIYLLTGKGAADSTGYLERVIFSAQFIDEEQNFGYGPAHFLMGEEVKELNQRLTKISIEELKLNFNPAEMSRLGIYPSIWEEGESAFEYLSTYFEVLKNFYVEASKNNQAIISMIS